MAFKWLTTCVAVRRKRGWFFRNTSFSVSIQFWFCQYSNITWALWHLKSPVTRMFVQQFVSIKKTPMCHIIAGDPLLRGSVMREAFPCHGVSCNDYFAWRPSVIWLSTHWGSHLAGDTTSVERGLHPISTAREFRHLPLCLLDKQ